MRNIRAFLTFLLFSLVAFVMMRPVIGPAHTSLYWLRDIFAFFSVTVQCHQRVVYLFLTWSGRASANAHFSFVFVGCMCVCVTYLRWLLWWGCMGALKQAALRGNATISLKIYMAKSLISICWWKPLKCWLIGNLPSFISHKEHNLK